MEEYIDLYINEYIPEKEYRRLLGYCIQYPKTEGGGFFRETPKGKLFRLHPSHKMGANRIFKQLNIKPLMEIKQVAVSQLNATGGIKEKMPLSFEVIETGINVTMNGHIHFVPNLNIDFLFSIIKSHEKISPRSIWVLLADKHQMFPLIDKAIEIVKNSNARQIEKDAVITELYSNKASIFEGRRVRKKEAPDLTYYLLYWAGIRFLKSKGLIKQFGTKDIIITEEGKQKENWR